MIPVLNIIHLAPEHFPAGSPLRTEAMQRRQSFEAQGYEHKFTHGVWMGVIDKELPWRGISKAHKAIVQFCKNNGIDRVFIAEDDFQLRPNGWKCFTENIPKEFDLFLAGISGGVVDELNDCIGEENTRPITGWSGLFMYCVHSRFYDCFLSADENTNIDRWLSGLGLEQIEKMLGRKPVYKVCWPMACITRDGVSFKSGEYVDHGKYWKSYQVL